MTDDQRAKWKAALAARAARQRRQRYGPQARGVRIVKGRAFTGAGTLRIRPSAALDRDDPSVTTDTNVRPGE